VAILTVQSAPVDGGLVVAGAAASPGGDEAPTGNGRLLYVALAAAGAPVTVTVATPATVRGLAIEDVTAVLDPGETWVLPLASEFRNPATGRASITYTSATNVSVAVVEAER
jgi:hypothetical protein